MLTALRRKFRLGMQRTVLIAVLLAVGLFSYAFLNLSFCFKLMSHRSLTHMVREKNLTTFFNAQLKNRPTPTNLVPKV